MGYIHTSIVGGRYARCAGQCVCVFLAATAGLACSSKGFSHRIFTCTSLNCIFSRYECSSLMVVQEVPRRQYVTKPPSLAFPSTETRCVGIPINGDQVRWHSHQRRPGGQQFKGSYPMLHLLPSCVASCVALMCCLMCCPQHTNVAEAVRNGVGLLEDWHSLDADRLLGSVQEVLDNPKYKEAVTRLSDLIMDTPQHPLDRSALI